MAVFVDLDEDGAEPPHDGQPPWQGYPFPNRDGFPSMPLGRANGESAEREHSGEGDGMSTEQPQGGQNGEAEERENPNGNSSFARSLGAYPIIMAIASSIDINTLDSLSRTCRQARANLLENRTALLNGTLHCVNEAVPVDPEDTLRYRARAGNWFYMEDVSRTSSSSNYKSGQCARDLVGECRRCGTVVCRNCAIKPPAPIVLRDRHRRLCTPCTKAPLGHLVKPRLGAEVPLSSEFMQRLVCKCAEDGVWLCQPCGRSIRSDDHDYKGSWRWHHAYGEPLGGLGTGIGDGNRGIPCGRLDECCAAHKFEQETDCDAEDAREAEGVGRSSSNSSQHSLFTLAATTNTNNPANTWSGPGSAGSHSSMHSTGSNLSGPAMMGGDRRTPSPALGPGYQRHEIEGIGGVVKRKRLRVVKVGACVPEWEDEKASGEMLGREIKGQVRSWCGWCWRVIPGKKDIEAGQVRTQK